MSIIEPVSSGSPPIHGGGIEPASGGSPPPGGSLKPLVVEYLHIFQRRKWWIFGVLALAAMLALVATLLTRPTYTATSQIEVSRDLKNVANVQGVDSEAAGRDLEFYQTQYSLLEARSLAERVVRRLRLESNEGFWDAHGVSPEDLEGSSVAAAAERQRGSTVAEAAAIELLTENITIDPIRGSSLINISYNSHDPEISAQVANTWATEFIAQSIARKFDSTAEARTFLDRRLRELRERVEESERALVDFAASRNIITVADGGGQGNSGTAQIRERTLTSDSLLNLNEQLVVATADRIQAESNARPDLIDTNNVTLARLREQRAIVAARYAELLVQFEPGYPAAKAVAEQLTELDGAIAQEEQRIIRSAQQQYRTALAREDELQRRVNGLSNALMSQRRDAIQYNIIQREADTNRQLYDLFLQRSKEIAVAGVSANNIAVIDRAIPPAKPSSPNLLLNLLLALVGGSVAALGLVFFLEQSHEGLTDPTKVNETLGIPLLGSVPKVDDNEDISELIFDPKSDLAEAYLAIRSSLAFTTAQGVPRSLMLVSSQPAEGKSTSAIALSAVLSRLGKRTVLIDVDLRNPASHHFFGVERSPGVSNYLTGESDLAKLIRPIAENLDFIPAGPGVPSAAELLSGDRILQLVRELSERYDHIIIDSAPILGLADAPLLSKAVQAVLFVIETGNVPTRGLRSALDRLRSAQAPLVGAILTKYDETSSGYGYGYGYSYSYRSDDDEEERAIA